MKPILNVYIFLYEGIFLTGHPISVLISFRSLIEMVTTVPFLSSNFMEHGQLLYGKIQWDPMEWVHVPDNRPTYSALLFTQLGVAPTD